MQYVPLRISLEHRSVCCCFSVYSDLCIFHPISSMHCFVLSNAECTVTLVKRLCDNVVTVNLCSHLRHWTNVNEGYIYIYSATSGVRTGLVEVWCDKCSFTNKFHLKWVEVVYLVATTSCFILHVSGEWFFGHW